MATHVDSKRTAQAHDLAQFKRQLKGQRTQQARECDRAVARLIRIHNQEIS